MKSNENHREDLHDALRKAEQRRRESAAVLETVHEAMLQKSFDDSAGIITESAKKMTGARSGYVALLSDDETENAFHFLDTGDRIGSVDLDLPVPIRDLCSEALKRGHVVYDNGLQQSVWVNRMPEEDDTGLENALCAPLTIDGKVKGIIGLVNKPAPFNENCVYRVVITTETGTNLPAKPVLSYH